MGLSNCPGKNIILLTKIIKLVLLVLARPQSLWLPAKLRHILWIVLWTLSSPAQLKPHIYEYSSVPPNLHKDQNISYYAEWLKLPISYFNIRLNRKVQSFPHAGRWEEAVGAPFDSPNLRVHPWAPPEPHCLWPCSTASGCASPLPRIFRWDTVQGLHRASLRPEFQRPP